MVLKDVIIRQYRRQDREFVRGIAWDTAFVGKPAEIFFSGKDTLADFLTLYFTDYEPESCFVAENNGRVVGYIIGANDTQKLSLIFLFKIIPRLLLKAILTGDILKRKNLRFLLNLLVSLARREFSMPDFSKDYPATLHINVDKDFRHLKIGSRLISEFLSYLAKEKIRGVFLATMSERAAKFFSKEGFSLLYTVGRSYFRYLAHKDMPVYIFGKRLA